MKETTRLLEMSKNLEKGSIASLAFVGNLEKILLNLKIQASYLKESSSRQTINSTIEDIKTELLLVKKDIFSIGKLGLEVGKCALEIKEASVTVEIINKIDDVSKELFSESVKTFLFLEKLRITCINLNLQTAHIGDSPEARAICVIVESLTREIVTLQKSAYLVKEASKEIGRINRGMENDQPKVYSKQNIDIKNKIC